MTETPELVEKEHGLTTKEATGPHSSKSEKENGPLGITMEPIVRSVSHVPPTLTTRQETKSLERGQKSRAAAWPQLTNYTSRKAWRPHEPQKSALCAYGVPFSLA